MADQGFANNPPLLIPPRRQRAQVRNLMELYVFSLEHILHILTFCLHDDNNDVSV